MARDTSLIQKRNDAIKRDFLKLSKGRCAKWRTEEIIKELACEYYLSIKRIYAILAD